MDTSKLKLMLKSNIKSTSWAIEELGKEGFNMDYARGRKHAYEDILRIIEDADADLEAMAVKDHMKGLNVGNMDVGIDHSITEYLTSNIIVHQCDGCVEKELIKRIIDHINSLIEKCVFRSKYENLKNRNAYTIDVMTRNYEWLVRWIEKERDEMNGHKNQ